MKWSRHLDNFEEYFCVASLAVMTLLVFVQVIMRYVFSNSLSWSEEVARYIFLWLSWVGASYAVRERAHFRVEIVINRIKGVPHWALEYVVLVSWFLTSFSFVWLGTELVLFLIENEQVSPAIELPMQWAYACMPCGCAMMCMRLVLEFIKLRRRSAEEC